ncbi:Amino-acid acetyltransferase, mitochondrial [Rhizina undulata]
MKRLIASSPLRCRCPEISINNAFLTRRCCYSRDATAAAVTENGERAEKVEAEEQTQLPEEKLGLKARGEDMDFYISILNSTSTKREARSYLQRFTPTSSSINHYTKPPLFTPETLKARNDTYVQRLLANHPPPILSSQPSSLFIPSILDEELHVTLVKIRDVSSIPTEVLSGVGRTLVQLKRLGLVAIVVIDEAPPGSPEETADWRKKTEALADKLVESIEQRGGSARRVDGSLSASPGGLEISLPNLLIAPLSRGAIPVLAPIAHNTDQRIVPASADELIKTLARLLSTHVPSESLFSAVDQPVSLDKLIFLDPLGGVPSGKGRVQTFVNLQHEFPTLRERLLKEEPAQLSNLETVRYALSLLPSTSSAIITSPEAASGIESIGGKGGGGRKRSKNPLIFNLLTDKPLISSSLPIHNHLPTNHTTLLKHGLPLRFFPSGTRLSSSPHLDLSKLVALIEDSFGRTLDVEHYLKRVDENIAAVIVAGEYQGAAIVTWEQVPGGGERIAYLDKFAVARKSQGAGGVADVVFRRMMEGVGTGELGREGIVWRSRIENVVNKWYFERAKGTWKIPGTGWTMFWTTEHPKVVEKRFMEYVQVCSSIEPSFKH